MRSIFTGTTYHAISGIVFGDRGERGLGLPAQVRIGAAVTVFEDLDDADAGEIKILAGSPSVTSQ
ncbi:hypothetical protein [Acrocarpospora sp. B8E8]|uniref:hypothetical protein n=1 Tax=Acrocarpospora sp. B8E8 TaxID=3153572 RepID=UPI00325D9562